MKEQWNIPNLSSIETILNQLKLDIEKLEADILRQIKKRQENKS
jgi:hypothetical protein